VQFHTYAILDNIQRTHWWFVSRRRILGALLERQRPGRRDLRILDVGCGTGVNQEFLRSYGAVTGLDNAEEALQRCIGNGFRNVLMADLLRLPIAGGAFDVIVAMDVIEHVDEDGDALRELYRILKPGGLLYITVPAFMFLWSNQDDVSLHKRRYRLPALLAVVKGAGFTVPLVSYMNFFMFLPILAGRIVLKILGLKFGSEGLLNPKATNGLITSIFSLEAKILPKASLPFGVSIVCLAERPATDGGLSSAPRAGNGIG
jgi:SAM-dependent methyltransferase